MADWYTRFAEIPGITYEANPNIDRAALKGVNLKPQRSTYAGMTLFTWPEGRGGSTSASPAHQRAFGTELPANLTKLVRFVEETLELPGIPSDYHFLLQHAIEALWKMRHQDPRALEHLERFARLNGQLILSKEDPAATLQDGKRQAYRVLAFDHLKRLYLLNGDIEAAWQAEQGNRRHGGAPDEGMERAYQAYCAEQVITLAQ